MDRYWLQVGRNIYDDFWKVISWFFRYDFSRLASTTSSQKKTYISKFSDKDSNKHLLGLQLWHLFKYAELTDVVRLNYKLFIHLLNKVWVGNIVDDLENLHMERFIRESNEHYPKDALHMHAENEPSKKRNEVVLNDLPNELYAETNDKIPDNCKYALALIQIAQNKKQTNKGGSPKLLKLQAGAKVMLEVNTNIQNCLTNGQIEKIRHTDLLKVVFVNKI